MNDKHKPVIYGLRVVFGIPEPDDFKPISNLPATAHLRYRFRQDKLARAFYKDGNTTKQCVIVVEGNTWKLVPVAENSKHSLRIL